MKIADLKQKLIARILEIEDEAFLNSLLEYLENSEKDFFAEPNEIYKTTSHELSPEQLKELDRRWKAYESGEEKAISWDEVKKEIEEKYGF